MINFREILWERDVNKQYADSREKAIAVFDQQVNAIREIAQSSGFQAIMKWWHNERQAALDVIAKSEKPRPLEKARYQAANDFITFIDSRLRVK